MADIKDIVDSIYNFGLDTAKNGILPVNQTIAFNEGADHAIAGNDPNPSLPYEAILYMPENDNFTDKYLASLSNQEITFKNGYNALYTQNYNEGYNGVNPTFNLKYPEYVSNIEYYRGSSDTVSASGKVTVRYDSDFHVILDMYFLPDNEYALLEGNILSETTIIGMRTEYNQEYPESQYIYGSLQISARVDAAINFVNYRTSIDIHDATWDSIADYLLNASDKNSKVMGFILKHRIGSVAMQDSVTFSVLVDRSPIFSYVAVEKYKLTCILDESIQGPVKLIHSNKTVISTTSDAIKSQIAEYVYDGYNSEPVYEHFDRLIELGKVPEPYQNIYDCVGSTDINNKFKLIYKK